MQNSVSRRTFLSIAGATGAALGLAGCAQTGSAGSSTKSESAASATTTGSIELDSSAWSYDSDNDVYYQIGVQYCEKPQAPTYESMGIYVPGAYFDAQDNGNGTFTCTKSASGKVGNYTAATAPIVLPINTAGYSAQAAPTSYSANGITTYTEAGFVYVYAGCRGRKLEDDACGAAPWGVTDLKAAVLTLRYNDELIPGDKGRIFSFGHSGGGGRPSGGSAPSGSRSSGSAPSGEAPSESAPSGGSASSGAPSGAMGGTREGSGQTSSDSTTYNTAAEYIAALNGDSAWISYDEAANTVTISGLAGFVSACKSPSKDVGAFDALDRSQAENAVFGNNDNEGLHFDDMMAVLLSGNADAYAKLSNWDSSYPQAYADDRAYVDAQGKSSDFRQELYDPLYYLSEAYEGAGTSTPASHWRIRTGITQGDTALTTEMNLTLALGMSSKVSDVDFATVWGQGHTMAERTGSSTDNFIAWVNDCCK